MLIVYSRTLKRLALMVSLLLGAVWTITAVQAAQNSNERAKFRRIPTQYIVALGDPGASSGDGAEHWGMWYLDPGPRGVWLEDYPELQAAKGLAPANWQFDAGDWWVDENGLLMESPDFPMAPGKYIVTGNREAVSILTIHRPDENGNKRWELAPDTTLYDVTHLECRSARYTPVSSEQACSPAGIQTSIFPVTPDDAMPEVSGCSKQDYSVLFVIGVEYK